MKLDAKNSNVLVCHQASPGGKFVGIIEGKYILFQGTLRELTGIIAKLVVKEKAIPKFFKPRPVSYVLKQKISEELE